MQLVFLAILIACVTSIPLAVHKDVTDENVASLNALKPKPVKKWNIGSSGPISKMESSGLVQQLQKIKQGSNRHSHVLEESRNEVSKNGHLVGSYLHKMDSRNAPGDKTHTSSISELQVPSLGIHERMINKDGEKNIENIADPETAAELAGYVLETGDQASVVQFLQLLLQEGKMSEEQVLAYVETIKKDIETAEESEREGERDRERQQEREQERERDFPRDDLDKIRKLVEAEERVQEERAVMEKASSLKETAFNLAKEENEHDLILRINDYLEGSLKEGKISKNLYNHIKEALIESVVESLRSDTGALSNMDYSHY